MPELPEVETLRRSLEPVLLGREIENAAIRRRDMVVAPGDPPGGFSRSRSAPQPAPIPHGALLEASRVQALTRHGKQLAIEATGGAAVIIHLGMTGGVRTIEANEDLPPHTHVVWELAGGPLLAFCDPRRFGLVRLAPEGTGTLWAALGPDALTIRAPTLAARLSGTSRSVKAALLDQALIAGVGNIYADEALFASGIDPRTPANRLGKDAINPLATAIRTILRRAVDRGGSTIRDYRDGTGRAGGYQNAHKVYGRGGQPCVRCGAQLDLIQVAQRTTVFCGSCQRE